MNLITQATLDRLRYWQKKGHGWNEAMREFCAVIAPDSYAPIVDAPYGDAYIDGFTDNKEIKDWLEYYVYEVPTLNGEAIVTTKDGKKYDFADDKDVIRFFRENYL